MHRNFGLTPYFCNLHTFAVKQLFSVAKIQLFLNEQKFVFTFAVSSHKNKILCDEVFF